MNPYLTGAGRCLLAATVVLIAAGALTGLWVVLLLGVVLAAIMTAACYALLPGALVLERRLVKAELEVTQTTRMSGALAGQPVELSVRVLNRGGARLYDVQMRPHMSSALRVIEGMPLGFDVPAESGLKTHMTLVAHESGRHALHGFVIHIRDALGLFEVGEYVAAPLMLRVQPDTKRMRQPRGRRMLRSKARDRAGLQLVRQRGFGTELRELRDHQHGDPFRAIAWKATARTRRLMVKEYESERVLNAYVCLDISSTMRGGYRHRPDVASKLEHGLQLAAGFAQTLQDTNDRVGLITFDEKVYGHLPSRDGKAVMGSILHHLIGTRHVVDPDLTEYTDAEVIDLVARYLLVQERLDFRRRSSTRVKGIGQGADYWSFSREIVEHDASEYDTELLERWLKLAAEREAERNDDPTLHTGVLDYASLSPLRRFCHLRGIELPYRVETRLGQKERGLSQCFEAITQHAHAPHLVMVITDLCGIMNTDLVQRSLRMALARRHRLVFVTPFTPEYVQNTGPDARSGVLHDLFTHAEADERRAVAQAIGALGVPVIQVGPDATIGAILRRLATRKRR